MLWFKAARLVSTGTAAASLPTVHVQSPQALLQGSADAPSQPPDSLQSLKVAGRTLNFFYN